MSLRDRVLKVVREYYSEKGSLPSMRYVARTLGISTKTLYKVFPGGAQEVYESAGVALKDKQLAELSASYVEFFALFNEYLKVSGMSESLASLSAFINDVQEYVRKRLGQAAASRLADAPLSTFNRVARVFLEVRKSESRPS
ncbi:MAG: hypothetical protein NZ954_03685 [Thermofilaceae archaeon]|nr:hypothetical protein [Thermofilaceae archaeon]MCX8181373.1 hypothetical protein [Thermofilaceae archaeon]MDW8004667.1 hypothetical protein [Thermofilaceae archaeon]